MVAISGCESLPTPANDEIQSINEGLAVFGVDGTRIFAGASVIINAVLAANQILLGRSNTRRGKALRGIESNPNSPTIAQQLAQAGISDMKINREMEKVLKVG